MTRLVNNDYRGADIIAIQSWFRSPTTPSMTGVQLNQVLRDTLGHVLPSNKPSDSAYESRSNRNIYTDHLRPGKYVEQMCGGYVVPTFDDLLRGLKYIPTGLDARDLTQCLVWYLHIKEMFSPPLEMNVLHTQSLIRALQQPLVAHGLRNLDKIALEEWKRDGKFTEEEVKGETYRYERQSQEKRKSVKSKMEIAVHDESIKIQVSLPLRHVFMFPFLAMIGMASKGIQVGVAKAEERRTARMAQKSKEGDARPRLCSNNYRQRRTVEHSFS
jgi:hypothetical protein